MESPEKELLRRNTGGTLDIYSGVLQNTGLHSQNQRSPGQVLKSLPQNRAASATMEELRDCESCTG